MVITSFQDYTDYCFENNYNYLKNNSIINSNKQQVIRWLKNNQQIMAKVDPKEVKETIMFLGAEVWDSGASEDALLRVYNANTVIACILVNQPIILGSVALYRKLTKHILSVLLNTDKYTSAYNQICKKYNIKLRIEITCETFWLIPLFLNVDAFKNFKSEDIDDMIIRYNEMTLIWVLFFSVYQDFNINYSKQNISEYKQFISTWIKKINDFKIEKSLPI